MGQFQGPDPLYDRQDRRRRRVIQDDGIYRRDAQGPHDPQPRDDGEYGDRSRGKERYLRGGQCHPRLYQAPRETPVQGVRLRPRREVLRDA